jgi:hypothetical protein
MTYRKIIPSVLEVKFKNHTVRTGDVWEWADKTVLVLGFVNTIASVQHEYSAKCINLSTNVIYTLGFSDDPKKYLLLARINRQDLSEQIRDLTQSQPEYEDF